jgi:hypothetical protein
VAPSMLALDLRVQVSSKLTSTPTHSLG